MPENDYVPAGLACRNGVCKVAFDEELKEDDIQLEKLQHKDDTYSRTQCKLPSGVTVDMGWTSTRDKARVSEAEFQGMHATACRSKFPGSVPYSPV